MSEELQRLIHANVAGRSPQWQDRYDTLLADISEFSSNQQDKINSPPELQLDRLLERINELCSEPL